MTYCADRVPGDKVNGAVIWRPPPCPRCGKPRTWAPAALGMEDSYGIGVVGACRTCPKETKA